MCYSAESSLNAFLIGTTSSVFLVNSKSKINKYIGFFFISVNLMQLLEYFIWKDQKCGLVNSIASRLITIVLCFQVFALIFGGYLFNTLNINKNVLYYLSLVIFFYMLYLIYFNFNNNFIWCSKPNKEGHLVWPNIDYNNIYTYLLSYIYMLVFLITPLLTKDKIKSFFILISGLSVLLYSKLSTIYKRSFESKWCYFSAFVPLFIIIFDFLIDYFKNKK